MFNFDWVQTILSLGKMQAAGGIVHFNWMELIPGIGTFHNPDNKVHVATLVLVVVLLIALSLLGRMALGKGEQAVAPDGRLSLKGFFEVFTEFIAGLSDSIIGEHGRKYVPMFAGIFFFIFFNNLVGMIPGMTPATDNLNTTLAVGLVVFVIYNYYGFKENGMGYLKHFAGPVLVLAPLMFCIEIISHLVRPVSLALRLKVNMEGDHLILGVFTGLLPYVVPSVFYLLGLLVCFLQAFIFTLLTIIYISMAIAHDH